MVLALGSEFIEPWGPRRASFLLVLSDHWAVLRLEHVFLGRHNSVGQGEPKFLVAWALEVRHCWARRWAGVHIGHLRAVPGPAGPLPLPRAHDVPPLCQPLMLPGQTLTARLLLACGGAWLLFDAHSLPCLGAGMNPHGAPPLCWGLACVWTCDPLLANEM